MRQALAKERPERIGAATASGADQMLQLPEAQLDRIEVRAIGLTVMVLWRRPNLHPPPGESGTGSLLLHYFSTNQVDSRGLRRRPVDSTAVDKRLKSNVFDHKLRAVNQLPPPEGAV